MKLSEKLSDSSYSITKEVSPKDSVKSKKTAWGFFNFLFIFLQALLRLSLAILIIVLVTIIVNSRFDLIIYLVPSISGFFVLSSVVDISKKFFELRRISDPNSSVQVKIDKLNGGVVKLSLNVNDPNSISQFIEAFKEDRGKEDKIAEPKGFY